MLSFWPGPGVNLLAGAGAGVFPPANAYFWPGPGRAGGRDFGRGRGRDRGRGPGRPLIILTNDHGTSLLRITIQFKRVANNYINVCSNTSIFTNICSKYDDISRQKNNRVKMVF